MFTAPLPPCDPQEVRERLWQEFQVEVPILEWQNRYDQAIFNSSNLLNVPLRLLKGVIAQESQFWPLSDDDEEFGLGRVTDYGLSIRML